MLDSDARFNLFSSFVADNKLIKVFHIKSLMSLGDIISQLRLLGDEFIGAEGIKIAYNQGQNHIPKNQWVSCFCFGKGNRVLFSRFLSGGQFKFNERFHKNDWGGDLYVLCCSDTKLKV